MKTAFKIVMMEELRLAAYKAKWLLLPHARVSLSCIRFASFVDYHLTGISEKYGNISII
jgi:hypothetical protein